MDLIIVESPTKAKTISRFLGKGYKVLSSFGHVRDLPKSKMGIDIEKDFTPTYTVPAKAKKHVTELKAAAAKAETVYYATDEDREGEAISWHLQEVLKVPEEKIKRIAFHEITKSAIEEALKEPRKLDIRLVEAQQARRVLDRLVGYELSPLLWRKISYGLSAGRVQSVAVRLIVEREKEIQAFKPEEYWSVEADLLKGSDGFTAKLHSKDGKKLDKMAIGGKKAADEILATLEGAKYSVASIEKKKTQRSPSPPFTTSTLQQAANTKLGFSAKQTMMIAQQLYEGIDLGDEHGQTGLITYMRTDSVTLSKKFLSDTAKYLEKHHAKSFEGPRGYKTKSKSAQEAHEAIRPTEVSHTPDAIKDKLDARQYKLYDLIWRRAVASQMKNAVMDSTVVNVATETPYTFRATGSIIEEPGFLEVYKTETKEHILPNLEEKDALDLKELRPKQHFTEPPARYSEATLVKAMEERGIGRPSTYAPTISTVIARGYVKKEEKRLKPTDLAVLVTDLLVEHFKTVIDYDFTAKMEDTLDAVAEGKEDWVPAVRDFYHPFHENLEKKDKELDKKKITESKTDEKCEKCGSDMIIKFGRFGKFMACSNYPDCKNTKPVDKDEIEAEKEAEKIDEKCETCGKPMVLKRGRFGPFLSCSDYPDCKTTKAILKKTGAKCPACGKGEIVEKKTKRGRNFYACDQYPDCDHAMWQKPTGENCPKCKNLLVFAKDKKVACSNKECDFIKDAPVKDEE